MVLLWGYLQLLPRPAPSSKSGCSSLLLLLLLTRWPQRYSLAAQTFPSPTCIEGHVATGVAAHCTWAVHG